MKITELTAQVVSAFVANGDVTLDCFEEKSHEIAQSLANVYRSLCGMSVIQPSQDTTLDEPKSPEYIIV